MSVIPFYICLGLLAAILILREWQNQRTQRELLNRLLVKHGVDPIPEDHPLAEAIKELMPERQEWPPKDIAAARKEKRDLIKVRFPVPGMDVMKAMFAKRKAE